MKYLLLLLTFLSLQSLSVFADCEINEIPVIVTIETAEFGSDTYWELIDDVTGEQYGTSGFFLGDNVTYIDTLCIPSGQAVTFIVSCCVNNMGAFKVEMLGATIIEGNNFQFQNEYKFVAKELPDFEVELTEVDLRQHILLGPQIIKGTITNLGRTTIDYLNVTWKVGNQTFTQTLEGLNLLPFERYEFEHEQIWQAEKGSVQVIVSLTNINGAEDNTISNNNLIQSVDVLELLSERHVLYESFSNASCSICALADPIYVNTVATNAAVVGIGYHSGFPGFDPMHQENSVDVNERMDYHQVFGVPYSVIEGGLLRDNTQFVLSSRVNDFRQEDALINLAVVERPVILEGNIEKVVIHVYVTPLKDIPSENLRLQIVITEREVRYIDAPGTNDLTNFYYVMRRMLPSAGGTPLADLQAYETQKISFEYDIDDFVRNVEELRTTVFIENTSNKHILQSLQTEAPFGEGNTSNTLKWGTDFGYLTGDVRHNGCPNGSEGRIEVELFGDPGDLELIWSNDEVGTVIDGLSGEGYELVLLKPFGIGSGYPFELYEPDGFEVEISTTPDTDGQANGIAQVEITNGIAPFGYAWSTGATTPKVEGLEMGTYEVSITDAVGCQQIVEMVIDGVTDIEGLEGESSGFKLYPNPVKDEIYLTWEQPINEVVNVTVYTAFGQVIKNFTLNPASQQTIKIPIGTLETGVYWLECSVNGLRTTNSFYVFK